MFIFLFIVTVVLYMYICLKFVSTHTFYVYADLYHANLPHKPCFTWDSECMELFKFRAPGLPELKILRIRMQTFGRLIRAFEGGLIPETPISPN